jgi:hypothetical protein
VVPAALETASRRQSVVKLSVVPNLLLRYWERDLWKVLYLPLSI